MKKATKKYTVGIHMKYLDILKDGISLSEMDKGDNLGKMQENSLKAMRYCISELWGIKDEDIDDMEYVEYQKYVKEINEIHNPQGVKDGSDSSKKQ